MKKVRKTAKAKEKTKKEKSLVSKLNKVVKDSDRNIQEIKLKPRQTVQKINDALTSSGFKNLQAEEVKLGRRGRRCLKYEAKYDRNGNFIGLVCVLWST